MDLRPGAKLGPYEILSPIGAGGMGQVWKARDTRLDRMVAIKVSAAKFSERFAQEARAIAALNHPNICTLHDVGPDYLVMEYVEGREIEGPLPLDRALQLAIQLAGALEAAHRKGITHRDLKPANILTTKSGIKVLDFGLAKIERTKGVAAGDEALTKTLTQEGSIVGTLQYMAPEQLQAKATDARADIFSFGCVLYEVLTGKRAFDGVNAASVIAAIMEREAPSVAEIAPAALDRTLRRCLAKDPDERWQTAGDLKAELAWIAGGGPDVPRRAEARPTWLPWAAAGVLALGAVAGWVRKGPAVSELASMTLAIVPPPGVTLTQVGGGLSAPEISPDGSAVMYAADNRLYVRRLASPAPQAVPGSEAISNAPFWSADSTAVVFPASMAQLMRTRMPDGPPEAVAPLGAPSRGGSWSDAGKVLIAANNATDRMGLLTGPISGGALKPVEMPSDLTDGGLFNPEFLSASDDFLFFFVPARNPDNAAVYLATLREGRAVDPVLLLNNQTAARYTPAGGGRILFVRNDNLYSQRLSRSARKLEGPAELVAQGVASQPSMAIYRADFSVARNGTVAWRPGKAALSQVTIFDRQGNPLGTVGPVGSYANLTLSPDEKQVLAGLDRSWLMDIGQPGRLALPNGSRWLGWSAGGSDLAGLEGPVFVAMSASGAGEVRRLRQIGANGFTLLTDLSPDGKQVLGMGERGIFAQRIEGTPQETTARVLVEDSPEMKTRLPRFSPDGRWLVYSTQEGLYVSPFPGPGAHRQIAPVSGIAAWRPDGKEIVYYSRGSLMSVIVEAAGSGLSFSAPRALFSGLRRPAGWTTGSRPLDVSRDGSRIFWLQGIEQPDSNMIYIKTGWAK